MLRNGLHESVHRNKDPLLTSVRNENLLRSNVAETPKQFNDMKREKNSEGRKLRPCMTRSFAKRLTSENTKHHGTG